MRGTPAADAASTMLTFAVPFIYKVIQDLQRRLRRKDGIAREQLLPEIQVVMCIAHLKAIHQPDVHQLDSLLTLMLHGRRTDSLT